MIKIKILRWKRSKLTKKGHKGKIWKTFKCLWNEVFEVARQGRSQSSISTSMIYCVFKTVTTPKARIDRVGPYEQSQEGKIDHIFSNTTVLSMECPWWIKCMVVHGLRSDHPYVRSTMVFRAVTCALPRTTYGNLLETIWMAILLIKYI